jgi:hypothetical protein
MFLCDLNQTGKHKLANINGFLKNNYSVSISENASLNDLYDALFGVIKRNQVIREDTQLTHLNPVYSQNILIIEGLSTLINEKEKSHYDGMFEEVLVALAGFIAETVEETGDLPLVEDVVSIYTSTGNDKYNTVLMKKIIEGFMKSVSPTLEKNYGKTLSDVTHVSASSSLYGESLVNDFFQSKSSKLLKQYERSMVNEMYKILGNPHE